MFLTSADVVYGRARRWLLSRRWLRTTLLRRRLLLLLLRGHELFVEIQWILARMKTRTWRRRRRLSQQLGLSKRCFIQPLIHSFVYISSLFIHLFIYSFTHFFSIILSFIHFYPFKDCNDFLRLVSSNPPRWPLSPDYATIEAVTIAVVAAVVVAVVVVASLWLRRDARFSMIRRCAVFENQSLKAL